MSPTANKDIACLLLVSSLDAKVATGARATDFTERCCFKLSVLETDAFADKSMVDWTIEAILVVRVRGALIYICRLSVVVLVRISKYLLGREAN